MTAARILLSLSLAAGAPDALPERFRSWLEHDVAVIVSAREREYFLGLADDAGRERFLESFWRARDPTPGTRRNEYREEHERRVRHADERFGRAGSRAGSLTDRGRAYVLFGEPQHRREHPQSPFGVYPCELWFYQAPKGLGLPPFFSLLFFQRHGIGDFRLYSPGRDGPEALVGGVLGAVSRDHALEQLEHVDLDLSRASVSLDPGGGSGSGGASGTVASEMLLAKIASLPNTATDTRYLDRLPRGEVKTAVSYSEYDLDPLLLVTVDPEEVGWVHYELRVPAAALALVEGGRGYRGLLEVYGEARDESGTIVHELSEEVPLELDAEQAGLAGAAALALQGCFPLATGSYRLSFLVRSPLTGQFGVGAAAVAIPGLAPARLELHSFLLALPTGPSAAGRAAAVPFESNGTQLLALRGGALRRGEQPWLFAQARYPRGEGEPRRLTKALTVTRDGVEVFGYLGFVEPNPAFDGGALTFAEPLRLGEGAPGEYQVTLVIGSESGETLAERRERFRVVDGTLQGALERPWALSRQADRTLVRRTLARQHLARGEKAAAVAELEREAAGTVDPGRLLAVVSLLLEEGEAERAARIALPLAGAEGAPPLAHVLAAASLALGGKFSDAAAAYERALAAAGEQPELLNALGEAYLRAGKPDRARQSFERSLELLPEQPEVRKALAALPG